LLFARFGVPQNFDLLSIDLDGNDFWVWRAIESRPRVVVIEYNSAYGPYERKTIPYDPYHLSSPTDYFGASLLALHELGQRKGYTLVHCERAGVNAFFIANECLPAGFARQPLAMIYRPPNYGYKGIGTVREPSRKMIDPFAGGNEGYSTTTVGLYILESPDDPVAGNVPPPNPS
jgi:hypothetical protein